MPRYIRLPLALELLFVTIEYVCPGAHAILPLGGSPIAQIGALLCLGVAAHEFAASIGGSRTVSPPPDEQQDTEE